VDDVRRTLITPPEPQSRDVVIVTINEETISGFPYRSPIDRRFLADLLTTIAKRGPRAIALDVLFDQPTEPDKDEALKKVLWELPVPLTVSYVDDPKVETPDQQDYVDHFVPPQARAMANFAEDQFDTARYILPGHRRADGEYVPGFARALLAKIGKPVPDEKIETVWHGSPDAESDPFRIYPAQIVRALKPDLFRNKIVLIGSDFSISDRHRTPYAAVYEGSRGMLPGIVIHAHAVSQLLEDRPSDRLGPGADLAIALAIAMIGALIGRSDITLMARIGLALAAIMAFWAGGFWIFHAHHILIELVPSTLALAMALWMSDSLGGREARRQREYIQSAFSRYVSPKIVDRLIDSPEALSLEGTRRQMTFMFTDLAGFTTLSETMESAALGHLLNTYLDGACQVIQKYDGTIDKFIGDAIFSIFNAPANQPDHAELAVRCAIDLDAYGEKFRAEQIAAGIKGFGVTRIGVHTGEATVGNFGSLSRLEYTALGDAVNTASRLEGLNKYFETRICVSASTVEQCPGIAFRPIGNIILKGKVWPLPVHEPLAASGLTAEAARLYAATFEAMAREEPEALFLFASYVDAHPEDGCAGVHLERLLKCERGIYIMMTDK